MSQSRFTSIIILMMLTCTVLLSTVSLSFAQDDCPRTIERIGLNEDVTGRITGISPIVQYCFEGRSGDQITIDLERDSGSLDAFLEVTDVSGDEIFITNDDRSLSTTDAQIIFTLPETSAYVINATRFDRERGTTQGTYTLTTSSDGNNESNSGSDDNETTRSGGCPVLYESIEYGDTVEDVIDDDDFSYFFCFTGAEGDEVVIDAVADDSEVDTLLILTDLRIEDVLAENDDVRLGNRDSRIVYTLPETGAFLITVARYNFEEGTTEGNFILTLKLNDGTLSPDDLLSIQDAPPYECNRPLIQRLSSTQWLEGNTSFDFRLNFGCEGLVAVSFLGEIFTTAYEFADDALHVTLDGKMYTVDSSVDEQLTLTHDGSEPFVFSDVGDCSHSLQQDLVEGVWFLEENSSYFRLDFMCNDVVLITLDSVTEAYTYDFNTASEVLTIGMIEPLIWTDVFILPGSFMSVETEDDPFIFTNVLVEIEDVDEADI